jgi:hypothetical protein
VPHGYEWSVLRVVPRVERGESVNVGVILYCQQVGYLAAQVTDDLSRALSLDPGLDTAAVARQLQWVHDLCAGDPRAGDNGRRSAGERFRWIVAPRSTVVQPAAVHPGRTDDPAAELRRLFDQLVAPLLG